MLASELRVHIDSVVPSGVTHIGFVVTNVFKHVLVTEPKGHPHGVSGAFNKVEVKPDDRPEDGSPSNTPEARLLRLLHDHHFPAGEFRKQITTSLGIATEPDWLHEPTKVAIYLDGMNRGLHGHPNVARKDQVTRQAVEFDGYTVIVVQKRDLDNPKAVRQHLRNIAQAMGREDLLD